ncbi:MAG: tetratricopeptide repeat protein [Myxococcota bacterium]
MARGRARLAGGAATLLLLAALAVVGCGGSPPVRAVRAARYYAAGTQALERGETRGAIDALERAADLMPNASEIHNHLGLAYWSDGREAAALRELERAVELDCENDAALGNLARLRARMAGGSGVDSPGASVRPAGVERSSVHGG